LNFKINKGEFICILGDVGSGKSSIISALIGDLLYLENDFYKLFKNMEYDGYLNERIKLMSQKKYTN
jgi:ABC-type cobalamin/Fe3+-siderophores transport system ATPase subunit